jgi:hypothetical protein
MAERTRRLPCRPQSVPGDPSRTADSPSSYAARVSEAFTTLIGVPGCLEGVSDGQVQRRAAVGVPLVHVPTLPQPRLHRIQVTDMTAPPYSETTLTALHTITRTTRPGWSAIDIRLHHIQVTDTTAPKTYFSHIIMTTPEASAHPQTAPPGSVRRAEVAA